MAIPPSISQAVNVKKVPFALTRSAKRRGSDDEPTLPSMRVSLKPKPLHWTGNGGNGTNVQMSPPSRIHQMVKKDSKKKGVRCMSGCCPGDAVGDLPDNLQQETTLQQLRSARVIACLRASRSNLVLDAARAALDGGLTALEVTMNTPSAAQVIKVLVREYPSAIIGAGTVLSTKEADMAKDAGAQFLMSPVTVQEIVRGHRNGPVLYIPGAMTPTEVISAYNLGAPVVKLYPVALLGGVSFVRTLSKPLGHIPMIASNGISLDMVESYISAGAMAVILSEAIFEKSALENNDMGRIRRLAGAAFLSATSDQQQGKLSQIFSRYMEGKSETQKKLTKMVGILVFWKLQSLPTTFSIWDKASLELSLLISSICMPLTLYTMPRGYHTKFIRATNPIGKTRGKCLLFPTRPFLKEPARQEPLRMMPAQLKWCLVKGVNGWFLTAKTLLSDKAVYLEIMEHLWTTRPSMMADDNHQCSQLMTGKMSWEFSLLTLDSNGYHPTEQQGESSIGEVIVIL